MAYWEMYSVRRVDWEMGKVSDRVVGVLYVENLL